MKYKECGAHENPPFTQLGESRLFSSAKGGYNIIVAIGIFFVLWVGGLFIGRLLVMGLNVLLHALNCENGSIIGALRKAVVCGTQICIFFLWVKRYEKRSIASIGFFTKNPLKEYLVGIGVGGSVIILVTACLWLVGAVRFEFSMGNSLDIGWNIVVIAIGWVIQSASEEIAIRGWLIPTVGKNSSPFMAIVSTAAIFGVMHLFTNGVTFLSFINLTISGLLFALYAIKAENIIGVCGLHFMWNFALGNIFGFPVSGFVENGQTIFHIRWMENSILTGGTFGPEGGLFTTAVLIISLWIILRYPLRKGLENKEKISS